MKALRKPSAIVGNLFPVVSIYFTAEITTNTHWIFWQLEFHIFSARVTHFPATI